MTCILFLLALMGTTEVDAPWEQPRVVGAARSTQNANALTVTPTVDAMGGRWLSTSNADSPSIIQRILDQPLKDVTFEFSVPNDNDHFGFVLADKDDSDILMLLITNGDDDEKTNDRAGLVRVRRCDASLDEFVDTWMTRFQSRESDPRKWLTKPPKKAQVETMKVVTDAVTYQHGKVYSLKLVLTHREDDDENTMIIECKLHDPHGKVILGYAGVMDAFKPSYIGVYTHSQRLTFRIAEINSKDVSSQ